MPAQAELIRRAGRALDFAEAATALLASERHSLDLQALEAPPDKITAETAMLLRAVLDVPCGRAPALTQRAGALARALCPWARHPRVQISLLLFPALALDYAAAHLALSGAGLPDPAFDRLLGAARQAVTAGGRERVPHRELEQRWLAEQHDRNVRDAAPTAVPTPSRPDRATPRPLEEAAGRTLLGHMPDLISGSRDDLYAMTHALMYTTDLGRRAAPPLPLPLGEVAASALSGALDADDFDLAGELLLTWPLLQLTWPPGAALALRVLRRLEDQVGVVPSLSVAREGYEQTVAGDRHRYLTATTYHTAYVMGLLYAVMLRQGRDFPGDPRPEDPLPSRVYQELTEHCLARLPASSPQPQWWADLMDLPAPHRGACWSFVLDVSVRRAVRTFDFTGARALLAHSAECGVPTSPLCAQAAGLLRRISLLPG